jgi:hypothetical protein
VSNTVRAVKVIPKHDARLSPKMREREIMNFTALSEVFSLLSQLFHSTNHHPL